MSAFKAPKFKQTPFTRMVRILAEVEKIWILYDLDENGTLDYEEIELYLKEMAYPNLNLTTEHITELFNRIDLDRNGTIDKTEMNDFIGSVLDAQNNLCFRLEKDMKVKKISSLGKQKTIFFKDKMQKNSMWDD